MDRAHQHLEATLEAHRVRGGRRIAHWLRIGVALVLAAFGLADPPSNADLVVRRRDTGAEVLRTRADVGDPEVLLAQVRQDLRDKTVMEFAAEWRLGV